MASWNDDNADDLRRLNEPPPQGSQDFNLFEEMARGHLYRGGQDAHNFLTGYTWGMLFMLGVTVLLIVIGLLAG